MFTHDVTFLELAQEPLLGDLLPYFLSKRKQGLITSDPHAKLKDEILAAFDVDVILDGFHYVMEQRKRGVEVFRRFYSEEERLADATKDETCLFYLPSKNPIPGHPFMLICPGGGYGVVEAMVEGFPVAKALNEMGINVFSLKYRVGHEGTIPMADADLHAAFFHHYGAFAVVHLLVGITVIDIDCKQRELGQMGVFLDGILAPVILMVAQRHGGKAHLIHPVCGQ